MISVVQELTESKFPFQIPGIQDALSGKKRLLVQKLTDQNSNDDVFSFAVLPLLKAKWAQSKVIAPGGGSSSLAAITPAARD